MTFWMAGWLSDQVSLLVCLGQPYLYAGHQYFCGYSETVWKSITGVQLHLRILPSLTDCPSHFGNCKQLFRWILGTQCCQETKAVFLIFPCPLTFNAFQWWFHTEGDVVLLINFFKKKRLYFVLLKKTTTLLTAGKQQLQKPLPNGSHLWESCKN